MKVFLSYSIRNSLVKREDLAEVKQMLEAYYKSTVYVDVIDNNYSENPQLQVENELKTSQSMIIIDVKNAIKSVWVLKELAIAKTEGIKIYSIDFESVIEAIKLRNVRIILDNLHNFTEV